jgi:hypothetical protein
VPPYVRMGAQPVPIACAHSLGPREHACARAVLERAGLSLLLHVANARGRCAYEDAVAGGIRRRGSIPRVTYPQAILLSFRERSAGGKVLLIVELAILPVAPLLTWLYALPPDLQMFLWILLVVLAAWIGVDAGRAAWTKVWNELQEAQRYRSRIGSDLEALAQRLYKRVTEWWEASLLGNRVLALEKRREADALMLEINETLCREVNEIDAGYFRRPRAFEPFRPNMEGLPDGNWINEMWHRVNRLDEIIQRVRVGGGGGWR